MLSALALSCLMVDEAAQHIGILRVFLYHLLRASRIRGVRSEGARSGGTSNLRGSSCYKGGIIRNSQLSRDQACDAGEAKKSGVSDG